MEEILIKTIEEKIENLERTKSERIEEMKKEQKLDKAYESLNKNKEEALAEIRNQGDGTKEASADLEKIETELEKVKIAESEIIKEVEKEINTTKSHLTEVNGIILKKENGQKNKDEADKVIENLLKHKEEALAEIRNQGDGTKEASADLEKIEAELEAKLKIREENEKIIEQSDKEIKTFIEKYDVKNILEEQEKLNADWNAAIIENEEFDRKKAEEKLIADWNAAILENEEFDRKKAEEKLNADLNAAKIENKKFGQNHATNSKRDNKLKNITILEGKNQLIYNDESGKEITASLKEINSEKRDMFKRLEIGRICKENTINLVDRIMLQRKINPAVIKALNNNKDEIKQYIIDLRDKKEFKFNLKHDLSGLSIYQKWKKTKFTKAEEKCGAIILGKVFNKNKTLNSANDVKEKIEDNTQKRFNIKDTLKIEQINKSAIQGIALKVNEILDEDKQKNEISDNDEMDK